MNVHKEEKLTEVLESKEKLSSIGKAILIAVPILLALVIYSPVITWLIQKWGHNPMYSHGFLIPPISGWLLWRSRDSFARVEKSPGRGGLLVLLLALGTQGITMAADVKTFGAYSLIALVLATIYFLWGSAATRIALFPVGFLFLMVPLNDAITLPISFQLKFLVARLSAWFLDVSGGAIVVREGVMIHMSSGSLEVADPCSGIRSIMALVTMAVLLGYLHNGKTWERAAIMFFSLPIAVVANFFRVVALALIMEWFSLEVVENDLVHTFTGLSVYLVALAGLLVFGRMLPGNRSGPGSRTAVETGRE